MELSLGRPLPDGVGSVSQWFGERPAAYKRFGLAGHNGLDYACPVGSEVRAMYEGIVTAVGNDPHGYGTYIKTHSTVCDLTYGHLSEVLVAEGQVVSRGRPIGRSGNSGNSTGPHLHVTLKVVGMRNPAYLGAVDPAVFRG